MAEQQKQAGKQVKKKLDEVDLFYIYGNAGEKTVADIAKVVGCEEQVVQRHVEIALRKQQEVPQKEKKSTAQPLSRNLFARKKERGFVGMTQAASEAGDDFREKHGSSVGVKGNEEHIHRPFGEAETSR